jgi:hypothetical protein
LGLGISVQIDQEGIPSLLITFVCCHNSCDFKIMVQRYEQMRRLQWYKCGAAYKYHDFLLASKKMLYEVIIIAFIRQ